MKIRFTGLFIGLFLILSKIYSQGDVELHLKVIKNDQSPVTNTKVTALETITLKTVTGQTNSEGIVRLHLNNGYEWSLSIGEMKKCMGVTAVDFNIVEMNQIFVYDIESYHRKKKQDNFRKDDGFKIITSTAKEDTKFEPPNCMLIIKMSHPDGHKLPGMNIHIVNVRDSIIYEKKTDNNGEAHFIIPNKTNYDIDINDFKNYTYSDFDDEYIIKPFTIQFAPTVVIEEVRNDTVFQPVSGLMQPSSERTLVKINVRGGKNKGAKESVYLREINSAKVYTTITDSAGTAHLLVPNGFIYLVDFRYEKNADAINLTYATEMTAGEFTINYNPDPRLEYPERFIPTTKNLLIEKFNTFLSKQFEKPKDKPFLLRIFSAKKINKQSKEALFKIEFSSSYTYGKSIRLPLNIAFVLDKSGSMYCCDRSESLKKSLWDIGHSLRKGDVASVVLFNDKAYSVPSVSENHLSLFETIIDNYNPAGGTNIYNGIEKGVKEIKKEFDRNKSNRVILLTDGYGITPPVHITEYVETQFREGIEFSTIGLGEGFNQSLLELIARKGNGTFSYVNDSIELSEVFLKEIKDAFNYIVKDLTIDIYHDQKLIYSNLYGYPVSSDTTGRVSFNIGKVPQNINQIAFLKFLLNEPTAELQEKPIVINISYFDLIKNKKVTYKEEIKLQWTEETKQELLLDQEEKTLYAIAILNQSLKLMAEAHELGNTKKAKEALKDGIKQVEEVFPGAKPKHVKKLFDEANNYILLLKKIENQEKEK